MAALYNKLSQAELKKRLYEETEPRITVSFYQYFFIEDPVAFRDELYRGFSAVNVFGRVYIASEGINAQVSVPETNFEAFRSFLYSYAPLNGLRLNIAVDDDGKSFWVLKIKVRPKIVADGITDPDFDMANKGRYVNADEFNRLTDDKETIVVDMRNHYEFEVGHFENAIEIPSDTFREQLPMAAEMLGDQKEKNIIMYCTGGIRCEKASAYMLHRGFKNVFHLEGGIINYANKVKTEELSNKFHGKNFVFDDRLGERITDEIIAKCHQCGKPADTHTNCVNEGCHLLFIQCDECKESFKGCCSTECMEVIALPEETQKELRKGIDKGNMIFNKSKQRLNATVRGTKK
ncbi:rhodanese-related sulfurtransferase [Ferruginibacter sp. HRS2-29]|uniref:oxygen-dependent tRNA uridine(34) hydroxylase TrhO n=1 Tax=Ferruginibacter sp. HRS2-29 TaxID=2487334 RepID=UPI0020CC69E0|nr:rhodanese-related sulfurtransferase [Ferruginibacter sp. HRS2-29]MCP9750884.1 rhodanese-related sulfurtransferase [Ferruginibacter sp. HRS2-29]